MRLTNLLLSSTLALSIFACRGGGGGDDTPGDDTPTPDSQPPGGDVTIQEVQNDAMPSGTSVELRGVVVVAIDNFGDRTGDLFVSELEGGAHSGVKVFGAALDQVAALAPGDLVNITGAKKHEGCTVESPCGSVVFENGASITEVMPASTGSMSITKVGTAPIPMPAIVDAKAIAELPTRTERDAEWEKWEGVLISVTNARQLSSVSTFGMNPGPDATEFRITGFARTQSVLTELPASATVGTCYDRITGVADFFFNYIIAPRSVDDLVGEGTGCNPLAESVNAVQSSATPPELVTLDDAVVTAVDDVGGPKGFWVADALQGAANNGVYVFIGGNSTNPGTIPAGLVVGATVDVVGGVDEFDLGSMGNPPVGDTVTEIVSPVISDIQAPAGVPIPATTASVEVLSNIGAPGEPWEGVLVTIGPVKVTEIIASFGQVRFASNDGATIIMDDEAARFGGTGNPPAPIMGSCYTVTGAMHVQVNADIRTINPRGAADIVPTTGCN